MSRERWSFSKVVILAALVGFLISAIGSMEVRERLAEVLGLKLTNQVEIMAVGDVMLGRSVNTTMQRRGDWRYPFLKTGRVLSKADVTIGNLEAPFFQRCQKTDVGMRFCADLKAIEGLEFAGFDVLTLANNHIFNYGEDGFKQTKEILEQEEIEGVGEGDFYMTEVEGIKIGFLAMDDVSKIVREAQIEEIKEMAKEVDILVVSIHWGGEYRSEPTIRQKELAYKLIEAGVKIIIGHHPHWVEPVEEYNGGYIFYSLGNFVFDQMWSEQTRKGMVARIWLNKEGVVGYELLPVKIYDYSQPRWENSN